MTVLLVGGTGILGGAAAEALAGRGEAARALVRSGQRTARLRELGFELEPGDLSDARALRRALRGVRAVVAAARGSPTKRGASYERVEGLGNRALIDAAREAGVEHLVLVSALKADKGPRVSPLALRHAAELWLRSSGMRYTILRPSSLQEMFGARPLRQLIDRFGVGVLPGGGRALHSFVAARDVARAAVLALDAPAAHNCVAELGGPTNLSCREAYRRITRVTGRRIRAVPLPLALLVAGGVLAWPAAPGLAGLMRLLAFQERAGYTCATPEWLAEALGRRRTFDEGVRAMYVP